MKHLDLATLEQALPELAPSGAVRIGIAVGPTRSAVWTAQDERTGKPTGVTVTLGCALAEALGTSAVFVEYGSSGEIIAAAASGGWDVSFTAVILSASGTSCWGRATSSARAPI